MAGIPDFASQEWLQLVIAEIAFSELSGMEV